MTSSAPPALHLSMAQLASADIKAVCLLLGPTVIVSVASDASGAVVASQQYLQRAGAPEWEPSFMENVLKQDPLLRSAKGKGTAFIADARQLLIPDELYAEAEVPLWFSACYLHTPDEPLLQARVPGVTYRLIGALPESCNAFLKSQKENFKPLPLGISLLRMPPASGALAQLTVFGGTAFGALYAAGGLKEGFACTDTNGVELAYNLKRLCKKHGLPESSLLLRCNALTEADRELTGEMRSYFPESASDGDDDSVLSSLMRVCACA